jgi:hypothetical protein
MQAGSEITKARLVYLYEWLRGSGSPFILFNTQYLALHIVF